MTVLLQLVPPIEVETPHGHGKAHIRVWNEDGEHYWTVFLSNGGAAVTYRNHEVRACENYTSGRTAKRPKQRGDQVRKLAARLGHQKRRGKRK